MFAIVNEHSIKVDLVVACVLCPEPFLQHKLVFFPPLVPAKEQSPTVHVLNFGPSPFRNDDTIVG